MDTGNARTPNPREAMYRHVLDQERQKEQASRGTLARMAAFFDSKIGFWFLSAVLYSTVVAAASAAYSYANRQLNADEIAQRAAADRALRDTETMVKLAPMITSEKLPEAQMGALLLTDLAENAAVDRKVAESAKKILDRTVAVGTRPGASDAERAAAEVVAAAVDKPRLDQIQQGDSTVTTATPAPAAGPLPVTAQALPTRLYIQIAAQSDRQVAEPIRAAFRNAGILVPDFEVIGPKRAPRADEIRYCKDKVVEDALSKVELVARERGIKVNPMAPQLCRNVRTKHFE
jgi:hypothetical protein